MNIVARRVQNSICFPIDPGEEKLFARSHVKLRSIDSWCGQPISIRRPWCSMNYSVKSNLRCKSNQRIICNLWFSYLELWPKEVLLLRSWSWVFGTSLQITYSLLTFRSILILILCLTNLSLHKQDRHKPRAKRAAARGAVPTERQQFHWLL